jgi:hypothetical protein
MSKRPTKNKENTRLDLNSLKTPERQTRCQRFYPPNIKIQHQQSKRSSRTQFPHGIQLVPFKLPQK